MKAIYASKLFIASKRKEQIKAALLSDANTGLVQQLAEDLDEEYKTPENLGQEQEKKESEESDEEANEFADFIVDEDVDPEKDLVTMDDLGKSSGPSKKSSGSAPKPSKAPSGDKPDEKLKSDTSDLMPESPANEKPEPAEASTKVEKEGVKAASTPDLNILKGTLNTREETAGVIRIAEKENEVWIYYNDDVNLNDIMVDVIECITCLDTQPLEFNRLARSDNAIVFVTELKSTAPELASIDAEEDNNEAVNNFNRAIRSINFFKKL